VVPASVNRLLAEEAVSSLSSGIRYRFGSTNPDRGLDCSAFVGYLFKEAVGEDLPRTAKEISDMGKQVGLNDMEPGDLVFFGKGKRHVSHVGIYVGGKKFIHASRKHGAVYESGLNEPYWQKHFSGARRLTTTLPRS
jgi:cell wall-associated NlpC family hydrolase